MAKVSVSINGRKYAVNCDDGNEDHVRRLADYIDTKVTELSGALGQIGDTQLLVMASILLADELSDALYGKTSAGDKAAVGLLPAGLAQRLDAAAAQIEDIAGNLERA